MHNDELITRQQRLLARSAQLRLTLAGQAQSLIKPLAVADQVRNGFRWLYRNPLWPLGALLVLGVLRPRRALLWAGRAWGAWASFKRVRNLLGTAPLQGLSRYIDR